MEKYGYHEVASIFPMLDEEKLNELAQDIKANGLREGIWIHDNKIIDGRNRYKACEIAEVAPKFKQYEGDDLVAFVISLNLHRRHLDDGQRALVASNLASWQGMTISSAAKLLNVSERSTSRAIALQKKAIPEVIDAVRNGEVELTSALKFSDLPVEQQKTELEDADPDAIKSAYKKNEAQAKAKRAVEQHNAKRAQSQFVGMADEDIELEIARQEAADKQEKADSEALRDQYQREYGTELGQYWIIESSSATHHLKIGDATDADDVDALLNEKQMDIAITDPPYNVDYTGKTKAALTIQNDKMSPEEFIEFIRRASYNMHRVLKPGAAMFMWHADSVRFEFESGLRQADWRVSQTIIWVKNTIVLGRQKYHWQHEPAILCWKKGASQNWHTDRTKSTTWFAKKPAASHKHPTSKPVELYENSLLHASKVGDSALDLFAGSGTLLEAAHKTDRIAYMMEKDAGYAAVILNRAESLGLTVKLCTQAQSRIVSS